jgi:GNAT superfamily N-acetyltransferase
MRMNTVIRKATADDFAAILEIYHKIHTEEENGRATTGWIRGIYPEAPTINDALARNDLFVAECDGKILASAIFNQIQVDVYAGAAWQFPAPDNQVMVMHTLVVDPEQKGKGLGRTMETFYENYALQNGCHYLRIDTNVKNIAARNLYKKLGYKEIGVAPCTFNGLEGINLVLLEKKI